MVREVTQVGGFLLLVVLCRGQESQPICKLKGTEPQKPFPSLTQCYKYNTDACCVSGHDSVINDAYGSLLSDTCFREYPMLELYFCLGCNPRQGEFTNEDTKEVYVCPALLQDIWGDGTIYDNCGLKMADTVVLPSTQYANALDFMNSLKPPFFDEYTFVEATDDTPHCFSSSARSRFDIRASQAALTLIAVVTVLLTGVLPL